MGASLLLAFGLATGVTLVVWDQGEAPDRSAPRAGPVSWELLPEAPLAPRAELVAAWAGDSFFVWGGAAGPDGGLGSAGGSGATDATTPALADGARFDPEAREWQVLEDQPARGRTGASAVWTGTEVVIWGGSTTAGQLTFDTTALAYNPATGHWRQSSAAPIRGRLRSHLLWTGTEVLIVGGASEALSGDRSIVAWNPEIDMWRTLAELPVGFDMVSGVHWTGDGLVVWGGTDRGAPGLMLNPDTGDITSLPPLPVSGPDPTASVSVLDGRSLFVAGVKPTPTGDELTAASLWLPDGEWEVHESVAAPGLPFDEAIRPAAAVLEAHPSS